MDWTVGGAKGAAVILDVKRTPLQARMRKLGIITRPSDHASSYQAV